MEGMPEALARAAQAITACADTPTWALPDPELITTLDTIHTLRERLAATELALLHELDTRDPPGSGHSVRLSTTDDRLPETHPHCSAVP